MNSPRGPASRFSPLIAALALAFGSAPNPARAASTDIADVPMAVKNSVTPNVLVVLDNSQSMDGYMGGTLVSGNDPNTRGNIGRQAMRNAITAYRSAFNWGLMSFDLSGSPTLYSTYAYLLGTDTGMVFTDDCTGYVAGTFNGAPFTPGISKKNKGSVAPYDSTGNRCVANPQPFPGGNFVTFDLSSDDSSIVDVLYQGSYGGSPAVNQAWAPATNNSNPTTYKWWKSHDSSTNNWAPGDFSNFWFSSTLTPTDAGYIPGNFSTQFPNNISRSLYLPRGWGYMSNITGAGTLNEAVKADSTTHYNNLMTLLGNETNSSTTGEIKNAAVFTPTTGTLQSAKNYFSGNSSPIQYACQQNFVMLVTDGLPTGQTNGQMYSPPPNTTNTCVYDTKAGSCTSGSFGQAATDAIAAVTALRATANAVASTNKDGSGTVTGKFDIQTYVVALASTLGDNASNMAVMNAMANAGGTGTALLATDTATFDDAITAITNDITAKVGASAAIGVSNAHATATDNASYASTYNSGTWSGDLNAYSIDLTTGTVGTTVLWSASDQLDNRTAASRLIATSTDATGTGGGIQFQPTTASTATKLSAAQQALLNTSGVSPADGAAVVAYLRGDRSSETTTGPYRIRAHLLGDIVDAEPVAVEAPNNSYADTGYQGANTAFKESHASRTRMVYQGANDGMLHAFVATTGAEAWAYIPNLVMANLNKLSSKSGFTHRYYVDGTPVAGDVDFKNTDGATGSGTDWRTILVGGLGKGGRGYYALDITDPAAADEAAVAAKVLWEFPTSVVKTSDRTSATANMGYSFGKPIIVKTRAKGWVVLVTSGYNNGTNAGDSGGDGLGHLFVVNPRNGDLIADLPTTGCTATPKSTPCGLAQISAYVSNTSLDNTTDFVYGGDLMGNLWRFDLSGSNANKWSVSKFAVLKDAAGATQPVTISPELSTITISGTATRFVYVGTGQYLGSSDVPGTGANSHATQTQTIYGLVDTTSGTIPDPLRSSLQAQIPTIDPITQKLTMSNNSVDYTIKKGWYVDLPNSGERINTDPQLARGVISFTSNIPNSTVCVPGGSSRSYNLNYLTGGTVENSTVTWSGTFLGQALASRPVIIQLPNGKLVEIIRLSDGTMKVIELPVNGNATGGKRVSWRELVDY